MSNFNWFNDVLETGRERNVDSIRFGGLVETLTNVLNSMGILKGKVGSCTLAWSTNETWLKSKKENNLI